MNCDPYYSDDTVTLHHGDALDVLRTLPDQSVNCCVTSPPYFGLRSYGVDGQYGAEKSPVEFVERLRILFSEVRRVLADDGTLWLNLGDSYSTRVVVKQSSHQKGLGFSSDDLSKSWVEQRESGRVRMPSDYGLPEKNLLGVPWRVAFALQDDGWILRNAVTWHKTSGMPESVTDRLSTRSEMVFLLTKAKRYWFDLDPIREPHADTTIAAATRARIPYTAPGQRTQGKTRGMHEQGANPGDVWAISTSPFSGSHFAVFPPEIPRRCILAGCKPGGTVLDPFSGSGTTGMVALRHGRRYVGIDLNADYLDLSLRTRLHTGVLNFEGG